MHKFVIKISDIELFKKFLMLTDRDYVDFFFENNITYAINNTAEVFGYLPFRGVHNEVDDIIECRVNKKILLKICTEGFLIFLIEDAYIQLDMIDPTNNLLCRVRSRKQAVDKQSYTDKIRVIASLTNELAFSASELREFCRIVGATKSIISLDNGIASSTLIGRTHAFQETKITDTNFSISSDKLRLLLSLSSTLVSVENFLGVCTSTMCTLVTKCRSFDNIDYHALEESKSAYKCTVNLNSLRAIINKLDLKQDTIEINLVTKMVELEYGSSTISIPISVIDEQKADGYTVKPIKILTSLFKLSFNKLPNCIFDISIKKYCIQLTCGNVKFYL